MLLQEKNKVNCRRQGRYPFVGCFAKWRSVISALVFASFLIFVFLGYSTPTFSQAVENQAEEFAPQEEQAIPQQEEAPPIKTPPNFALDKVKEVTGAVLNAIIVQIEKSGQDELWLFNLESETSEDITSGASVASDFPIGFKGGWIFWLAEGKGDLFAFHPQNKTFLQKPIPIFDPARGERARIRFSEISWEIIVDADNFYFFSNKTGEVFSDGNSEILESFRKRFDLDRFLTKEELSDLSFSIDVYE